MNFLKDKNKGKRIIFFLLFIAFISFLLFNRYGILKYIDLVNQEKKLRQQIEETRKENDDLRNELDSLKTEDSKIEKVAREKYNMKKSNEKVIKIEEK